MFWWNGIDSVTYEDRQSIISQVVNVLVSDGIFIYSTHNLQYWETDLWVNKFWVKELFDWRGMVFGLPNRLLNFKKQWIDEKDGVAFINEPAHRFTLMMTSVDIPKELEALKRWRFSTVATIGNTKQTAGYDGQDHYVYIVAQKT